MGFVLLERDPQLQRRVAGAGAGGLELRHRPRAAALRRTEPRETMEKLDAGACRRLGAL